RAALAEYTRDLEDKLLFALVLRRRQVEPGLAVLGDFAEQTGAVLDPELVAAQAQVEQRLLLPAVELAQALAGERLAGWVRLGGRVVQCPERPGPALDVDDERVGRQVAEPAVFAVARRHEEADAVDQRDHVRRQKRQPVHHAQEVAYDRLAERHAR